MLILDRAPTSDLTTEVLLDVVHRSEPHEWPNIIVALDKYLVTYACDGGICPNTGHARGVSTVVSEDASDTLLRFYLYLSQALTVTSVSQVSSWEYLGSLLPMRSEVIHCTADDEDEPPPYLSSLNMFPWNCPYEDESDENEDDDGLEET